MGRDVETIEITARLSAHNDERDESDRAAWEHYKVRIATIAEEPQYADIDIFI